MMHKPTGVRGLLWCVALLLVGATGPAAAQSASAPQPAASGAAGEAAPTVRAEIATPLIEAQRLLGEKNTRAAADKVRLAEAVPDKTAYEQHVLARVKGAIGVLSGDADLAAAQYQIASTGPWMKLADKLSTLQAVASLYYHAKNYTKAIDAFLDYKQLGGNDPTLNQLLAQSYYLNADYANAAKALEAITGQTLAQGKVPPEMQFKLLADARGRLRDTAGHTRVLETLVQHYPSQANWRTLMSRLWARPQLATRLQLEVFRLQLLNAGLADATDYTDMAALALQEGASIEAAKILEQGYAAGLLARGEKGTELQRLTDKVNKSATEDRASLEKDLVRARTLPDGLALFNYGFNLFHTGQTERGVAQMEQALGKGIARNADMARLRLVAVYAEVKQRDKALKLLTELAGKTDPIGFDDCVRYWNLFLQRP